jgi:transposase
MALNLDYERYLEDSDFIKYGIVVSFLVWKKSYTDITEAFKVSKPYITKILQRLESDGEFHDKRLSNGGHNKKWDDNLRETVVEMLVERPSDSLRNVSREVKGDMNIEISPATICQGLKSTGYVKSKPSSVPFLSKNAITKRDDYATLHLDDKFSNVCFSDECMFQLSENRQLVWWNKDSEDKPTFEQTHDKSKVMIWAGISRKGITDIYWWKVTKDFTVDAREYTKCLKETLIAKMNRLYGSYKWRFMQDNARPHTANYTREYLESQNVRLITHPPYSPDLNPIEKVWAYLKKKVMCKSYKNLDEVLERIFEEWYKIPGEMLNNLIDGHCKRVREVYENYGGFPGK